MKMKLPHSVYNWVSLIGATIALISFSMIVFLFAVSVFINEGATYLGLVIYIILPSLLVFGLILIPIGMYFKSKKEKKGEVQDLRWPIFNLNEERQRNAATIFIIGTTIFLFATAIGSYEAFHFTESNQFCGEICHTVMAPEYTAYQSSPHARVKCVDCHVGTGADWYVRSKMSGMYQVYAVLADNYPRPIPTPISNLRPAQETCEQCHWPEKFYAHKLKVQRHYLSDEKNSEWDIHMLMKIGPDNSALGLAEGIHWHINPDIKIEYKSSNDSRQSIPWVKYTNLKTGEEHIYLNEDEGDIEGLDTLETRVMDCVDCHNRPSHNYKPPAFFVNNALTAETMPKELPGIKSLSMEICGTEFSTMDSAMQYIEQTINEHYESNYDSIYTNHKDLIDKAVVGLQNEFKRNIFPEMKVRWDAYPNNIGHVEFNGCFRCHNDLHVSDEGRMISKDCNLCHTIIAQGPSEQLVRTTNDVSLDFKHPVDIDEMWRDGVCTDCHTGLNP